MISIRALLGWLILKVLCGLEAVLFLGPRLSDRWLSFLEKYEPWKSVFPCDVIQFNEGNRETVLAACRGPDGDEQARMLMGMVNEDGIKTTIKDMAISIDDWIDPALPGECAGITTWPRDEAVLLALRDHCDTRKVSAEVIQVHPSALGMWVERAILILRRVAIDEDFQPPGYLAGRIHADAVERAILERLEEGPGRMNIAGAKEEAP